MEAIVFLKVEKINQANFEKPQHGKHHRRSDLKKVFDFAGLTVQP